MYHYYLNSYYYNKEECENIYTSETLIHEKLFSKEDFQELCKNELKELRNRSDWNDAYALSKLLIEKHGFKSVAEIYVASFEFNEDGDDE